MEYVDEPGMVDIVFSLRGGGPPEVVERNNNLLAAIEAESSNETVQGAVCYSRASALLESDMAEPLSDEDCAKLSGMLDRLGAEYAAIEDPYGRGTFADMAVAMRFEFENLRIGSKAPDLSGLDTDGAAIKLSDYRGRVVFLDFWAHW